ncbi:hypothetical protein [Brachyspira pilosicoli]|uniref:Sel1 domain protein repeat-containing protein n=1 Tax=Brachyspira pilosicoli TaxID=52584 RepID=A0A5C8F040_BRAPL|nr:hypothetical protein [Brachyspira pilosicoli]TXJ43018.1 hypothetical protein EPJ72_05100 [Brachyspira pilosicoli]
MNLTIPYENKIKESDKKIIEEYIENNVEEYKNNYAKLTELTMDAVSSLSASKSRTQFIANQGFIKNILNTITGQNRKIRYEIDYNYSIVKNASIKMIETLARQNKITYEGIIYLNNKLNNIGKDIDEELIAVCENVRESFNVLLNKIDEQSSRIDNIEKKVQLLEFKASKNILEYNGLKYIEMDDIERLICLSNDLYHSITSNNKKDSLVFKDNIFMIKSILFDFNINLEGSTSLKDFYLKFIEKPYLIDKIFSLIDINNDVAQIFIPILGAVKKLEKLNSEENYIVSSILEKLTSSNIEANITDIKFDLIKEYGKNISNFDYETTINNYELIVLIMNELKIISTKIEVPAISLENGLELIKEYYSSKQYLKVILESSKIKGNNKEILNMKIDSLYKILVKEVSKTKDYKEIAKVYLIKSEYDKSMKYLNKYFEEHSNNKELYRYKNRLKELYEKTKKYQDKISKQIDKTKDDNKKEYLDFLNDFWGLYLSKIK